MMFTLTCAEPAPGRWLGDANHMMLARAMAVAAAQQNDIDVLISAGGKPRLVVHPDGSFSPPPGSKPPTAREACKRDSDETCFCAPCRAARRTR